MTDKKNGGSKDSLLSGTIDLPEMENVLALYRDLLPVVSEDTQVRKELKLLSDEEAKLRLEEGFTLIQESDLIPSKDDLQNRTREVYSVLDRYAENEKGSVGSFVLLEEPDRLHELCKLYLSEGEEKLRDRVSGIEGVNPETAMFVIFNSLKGVFLEAGKVCSGIDKEQWEGNTCPVCGGSPAVAHMEGEGGKRLLICHRCETRYRFMRVLCPYCLNNDHKKLGYFTIDDDEENIRVDFCKNCNCYIKTWNLRDDENIRPEVEDLLTPRFDLAAEKEGFRRGAPNIFGIWVGFDDPDVEDAEG